MKKNSFIKRFFAAIQVPSEIKPSDVTLPLGIKVNFQDPLRRTDRRLTSNPNYWGSGSITITNGKLILEGVSKSRSFLFGAIGSVLAGLRKNNISITNIEKIFFHTGYRVYGISVVFNILHQDTSDGHDCICSFSMEKNSDFFRFYAALRSLIPPKKLFYLKTSTQNIREL